MMKKITQNLLILLMTVLSVSLYAQITNTTGLPGADLIYHEDGRYTSGSGYAINITGPATVTSNAGTKPADDAAAGYTRPVNNYPDVTAADYTVSQKTNNVGGGDNTASTMWYVINSVDLAGYDAGSKFFTIVSYSQYFENGSDNIDDQNEFWYRNSATGDDPTAGGAWTQVPLGLISSHAGGVLGADALWVATKVDLSSITCGNDFAIALKRTTSTDGPNPGETDFSSSTNRNGSFFVSSHAYTGSTTPLSIEDDILSQGINVYPNPTNNFINIRSIDSNIEIKNVSLMDMLGRTVYTSNKSNSIDVSSFTEGIYFLKLESQDGGVLSKKIIVN